MMTGYASRWCLAAVSTFAVWTWTASPAAAANKVVIVQTNSAGDNVHVIDPETNKVIGEIEGIEVNHGAAIAPDGSRIYVSDEALSTLDVVDAKTLKVIKKVPLSGHPNNLAVGRDGRRVYVGIIQAPGGVDVIDTASLQRVKTLPTHGTIHNAYVTPDQKTLVVCSRLNNALYSYSLPDLKVTGTVFLGGKGAAWVTLTPDGKKAYVANPVTDDVSVVDLASMKEIALIPVGYVPKRNTTGTLQLTTLPSRTPGGR